LLAAGIGSLLALAKQSFRAVVKFAVLRMPCLRIAATVVCGHVCDCARPEVGGKGVRFLALFFGGAQEFHEFFAAGGACY
jgi:hypothetical protein